jgi:5-(carboxyamino)imidazole ribonucleotide synthase
VSAGSSPIVPPATIGILGGGQLGRMTALAARSMGYHVHVLDPDAQCATAPVADRCVAAEFDDADAARDFAQHCDVITLEIEQIATDVIDAARHYAPTRPGSAVIGIIQDRAKQKAWLHDHGFPVGQFRIVRSAAELRAAVAEFGATFVKRCRGGFDGRGQARLRDVALATDVWKSMGQHMAVAERGLALAAELSVMIARRPGGEMAAFPVALNHHERQVLSWSTMPAPLPPDIAERATTIGLGLADQLRVEGLIAVEMFLTTAGEIFVNELAPRPHNSFHASERACVTGQFEQLVRAVCNLPFGDVSVVRPAAIVNLFGDLWHNGEQPRFEDALAGRGTRLHLYGKGDPRPGRKMGHLSAVGATALDALSVVREAARRIGVITEDPPAIAGVVT